MNRTARWSVPGLWRRLTLWPRLAIGVTIGFIVLFAGFSVLGIRAVDASTSRILHERLAITEEMADDFDSLLRHRLADLAAYDARSGSPAERRRLLAEVFHAADGAFTSVVLLDRSGRVVVSLGTGGTEAPRGPYHRRAISRPFRDALGRPVVALAVPVRTGGTVVGLLNLAGPDVTDRLDAARRLGTTGHAELVGPDGIALASTEPGAALRPGEHLGFYREMLASGRSGTATVGVTPGSSEPTAMSRERHVMAFVRLTAAPWAVSLGGTDSETYAPAHHLRKTLMLAGGGSLAALWLLTLLGARLLVRPVRDLTRAAEQMASGDLEHTVSVSEGGEIGTLAESLETMRTQLRGSHEELEHKVAERTAELNERNRQLAELEAQEQMQRMRNELISAVSHELRTPLGFIKSYATTLLREDAPIDDATRRRFLGIIDEETEKLEHMIGELLDASRLQAGRLPIEREIVSLGDLLTHAADKARPALSATGHELAVALPAHEVIVLADPMRIEQVLDNLLENASRYAEPHSPVELRLATENGKAVTSVTNHGDAVAVSEIEQIFEPFYRGRTAKERSIRGAGLGLAICRGIVEAHGGRIWCESGTDHMTAFVLTLPLGENKDAVTPA
ncbi:MAG: ATP-binding protein [Verrucomicrobiota bacterium]